MKVTEHIYIIGSGNMGMSQKFDGNIYLLDLEEELVMIDSGVGLESERIVNNIKNDNLDTNNLISLSNLVRVADLVNILPVVRIKEGENNLISNVLDLGAGAVQIPHIKTKEDIATVSQYSKFFPEGSRGLCRFVRAANYSATDLYEYFNNSNKTINIIQKYQVKYRIQ